MRMFVEFDTGDRSVPSLKLGDTVAVNGSSPINIRFISWWDARCLWLYAESLNGPWHYYGVNQLFKVEPGDE